MHKRQFRLKVIAAATAALFAPTLYAQSAGRVDFATPGVNLIGPGGQSRPASKGGEIAAGETIDTGTGRAQLRFTDGGLVSLQPQTQFRIESYGYDKDDSSKNSIVMNMLRGGLRTITGLIGKTNRQGYKLQTATATVGIRGTEFLLTGNPDGSIVVSVADGSVDISNRAGTTVLNAGESALVTSPNSAPTKTDEKPFLPPLAYNNGTQLAQPVNPVQDAQPAVTTVVASAKLTGTFQGQWATGSASNGFPNQPMYSNPTFTLDANGNLQTYGQSGTMGHQTAGLAALAVVTSPSSYSETNSLDQGGVRLYGNDGVMAWGTWVGGPTSTTVTTSNSEGTFTNTNNSTYPANDPLHWVVGQPVSAIPTSGSASYSLYGGTAPSCVGAGCTGAISISSSFTLDFAKYSGLFNLSMKNAGDGVSLNTGSGLPLSLNSSAQLFAGGQMTAASGSTAVDNSYLYFGGFLAGVSASNAGGIYNINYQATGAASDTGIAGALVYSRGGVGGGAVAGNWATTTQSGVNNAPPADGTTPSFFALDTSGALQDYSYGQGGNGFSDSRGAATAVVEGQADGVLTWGHWTGGPTVNGYSYTDNYGADPLHYITGSAATNMPTTGVATYSQVGMTTPSCGGQGASCGNITINSSLNVDFSALSVKLNFSLANDGDGVQLSTQGSQLTLSGQRFSGSNLSLDNNGTQVDNSSLQFDGFLAGNGATHAGGAYKVNYSLEDSNTNIAGAIAYKRGDVAAPVAGSWAILSAGRGGQDYQSWTAEDGATYAADSQGLASVSGGSGNYTETRGTNTAVQEGSADGVLAWGHWSGGQSVVSNGGNSSYNYPANDPYDPLHYITGTPVTAMPTTGVATFNQVGYTTPSCVGFSCAGTITINSSMSVDFLNMSGRLNFALQNSSDGVKLTTLPGGAGLTMGGSYIWNDSVALKDDAGSSGSSNQSLLFEGFLAGTGASHAGAVYNANYTANNSEGVATSVAGAVGYKRDATLATSPTPVSQGLWAVGTLASGKGTSLSTPFSNPYGYLLDNTGALASYSTGQDGAEGAYRENVSSATAVNDGNADGVLNWGHWVGGPTSGSNNGDNVSNTYDPTNPLHYITGTPATNMPTAGTATYSQVGMTTPSCSGPSCGTISVNSSMFVDFSQYTAKLNFALANSGDGVKLTTQNGGAALNIVATPFIYTQNSGIALQDDAGSTGAQSGASLAFQGFFAGDGATHAGGVYNVNYTGVNATGVETNVAGALAYKSGGIAIGDTPVTGGNWAVTSADYSTNASNNTTGTTGYVLSSGAVSAYGSDANYSGFQTQKVGSATAIADGNDGVMSWGRWTGGPTSNNAEGNQTFSSGVMHYVAGLPVTNMPVAGQATYTSYGGSQISCAGASCGAGAITASSTMNINFAGMTGTFNIALNNANDGAKLTGTSAMTLTGPIINALNTNLSGSTSAGAITGGNVTFNGFLAGPQASHAGGVFNAGYSAGNLITGLSGALVYQRGSIVTGPPP